MVISVPKRLVRLAVRRNAVKRVARESWRHAAASDRGRLSPPAILLRLVRLPAAPLPGAARASFDAGSTTGPADDSAPSPAPTPARRRKPAAKPVLPPLPLMTFKRLLRADLDAIWAGHFRPSGRRGPRRSGSASAPVSPSASSSSASPS